VLKFKSHMSPIITKKIIIEREILRAVTEELKTKKDLTQKRISEIINSNIVNSLNRGDGISEDSFKILESLIERKIPIKSIKWRRRYIIEDMKKIAEIRGGKCLSLKYSNYDSSLMWECNLGHQWKMTPHRIIADNSWCPFCLKEKLDKIREKEFKTIKKIIHSKGGKCLSSTYINNRTKILIECKNGHQWSVQPRFIKNGNWCPYCWRHFFIGEEICRKIFEYIFKVKFPKFRPKWLVNEFGNYLELDGYNEKLKLAFEYQGQQHYDYFPFFHKNHDKLERRKKNDQVKVKLCRNNEITLITIPYYIPYDNMQNYIIQQYRQKTGIKITGLSKCDYKEFDVYSFSRLKEMQKMAIIRGGKCLSSIYIGSNKNLLWECENGHQWNATPDNIKHNGSWCPICHDKKLKERRKKVFEEVKSIIHSKGGICLSPTSVDSKTKIFVECENGHHWSVYPRYIKYGHWCPVCWNIKKTNLSWLKKI